MDASGVAKALKARVFPILREANFSEFGSRTAWRIREHTIDVLDFHSLGYYLGSAVSATAHSFVVTAGVHFKAVHAVPWAEGAPPDRPKESDCHARRFLWKRLLQLRCWRPDVWYVNRSGSNLDRVMAGLVRVLHLRGIPYLTELGDLSVALDILETRDESCTRSGIWKEMLSGGMGSFSRAEVVSALALALGDVARARKPWEAVLVEPYYQDNPDLRQKAEERLALLSGS